MLKAIKHSSRFVLMAESMVYRLFNIDLFNNSLHIIKLYGSYSQA
jgi:hypothetical protein